MLPELDGTPRIRNGGTRQPVAGQSGDTCRILLSNTADTGSGTENEAVEVVLSPILLNASRLFVRIQAR